jgi:hypothetical protein
MGQKQVMGLTCCAKVEITKQAENSVILLEKRL